ncbi:ABC transporter ATP-binding protein [Desulfovibrio sp. MES5]|uniref:ABC transporter ATP-binding protein n=1 Tax=Desulfovibrio sp. MES5 TaxID=1899016 RepID=UPI0025C686D7|nr:ABC transporter ATP-binding protein [Desulfovibrio sp. MES5]
MSTEATPFHTPQDRQPNQQPNLQPSLQQGQPRTQAGAPLLRLDDLSITFQTDDGPLPAVRNVSFSLPHGHITCLVGESGCGKSLTARAILRLTPDNARLDGSITLDGQDILRLPPRALRSIRGRRAGMVFQEPMTSLNPVLRVGEQVAEPLRLHMGMHRAQAREEAISLLAEVGIPSPESRYDDYPHQLSGGMRQRVMIAMALACRPDLLLADEPTTALDATIQGQILRLMRARSQERGMAVLLITHDLGVAAQMANTIGVMYAGRLVEYAPARDLFAHPLHPYTQGLLRAAPNARSRELDRLPTIPGSVPSLRSMPGGCPFHPRCPQAMPVCREKMPPTIAVRQQHNVACWLHQNSA